MTTNPDEMAEYRAWLHEGYQPVTGSTHDRRCDADLCHTDCPERKRRGVHR